MMSSNSPACSVFVGNYFQLRINTHSVLWWVFTLQQGGDSVTFYLTKAQKVQAHMKVQWQCSTRFMVGGIENSTLHFLWSSSTNLQSMKWIRWMVLGICRPQTDRKMKIACVMVRLWYSNRFRYLTKLQSSVEMFLLDVAYFLILP